MAERKPQWPENGDLVIATIETVTDYGAYAKLDEFDKRGLLHVSEISSSWIRNIRDFIRENQKVVLKVLRVDHEKGHIDLSLRRVTKRERIEKIMVLEKGTQSRRTPTRSRRKNRPPTRRSHPKNRSRTHPKIRPLRSIRKSSHRRPRSPNRPWHPRKHRHRIRRPSHEERIHVKLVKVRGVLEIKVRKTKRRQSHQRSIPQSQTRKNQRRKTHLLRHRSTKIPN